MKIYIASSWKNEYQPRVVEWARMVGFEVYDFKNPQEGDHGFHWTDVGLAKDERPCTLARLKEALQHPRALDGYKKDSTAMMWADACVLVLPAGRSAHLEAGWMAGAGKRVLVYAQDEALIEPELMYGLLGILNIDEALCTSWAEVCAKLHEWKDYQPSASAK